MSIVLKIIVGIAMFLVMLLVFGLALEKFDPEGVERRAAERQERVESRKAEREAKKAAEEEARGAVEAIEQVAPDPEPNQKPDPEVDYPIIMADPACGNIVAHDSNSVVTLKAFCEGMEGQEWIHRATGSTHTLILHVSRAMAEDILVGGLREEDFVTALVKYWGKVNMEDHSFVSIWYGSNNRKIADGRTALSGIKVDIHD